MLVQVLSALQHAVTLQCGHIEEPQPCHTHVSLAAHGSSQPDDSYLQDTLPLSAHQPSPVLVLFSGGVDSTLISAMTHRALPPCVPIDLACVCFDGGQSPDRLAALDALQVIIGLIACLA